MFGGACCSSVVSLAENVESGQHVEDENRRPAEEEEEHDEDQHVDDLLGLLLSDNNFVIGRHLDIAFVVLLLSIFLEIREKIYGYFTCKRRLIFILCSL